MTTIEILNTIRRKILETTDEVVTTETLLLYVNLAFQDVYKRIFPNSSITSSSVVCTAGVCTLPATFGTMYGAAFDTANNPFEEVSIADFSRQDFDRAVTVENGTLKVYPVTTPGLTIKYWPKPATLTTAVNPTIDEYFHEPIVYGGLYRAYEDLQDESLAQFYQARFKQEMADRLEVQSTYEETNQRGGAMFTEQNLVI